MVVSARTGKAPATQYTSKATMHRSGNLSRNSGHNIIALSFVPTGVLHAFPVPLYWSTDFRALRLAT